MFALVNKINIKNENVSNRPSNEFYFAREMLGN